MKKYLFLIFVFFVMTNGMAQENKVKFAVGISNTFTNCFTNGRYFDLTTFGFGIDIKRPNSNFRLYATYGINTYIEPDKGSDFLKSFSYRSNLLGLTFEYHFLNERKIFRPFVGIISASEIATNYKNGFIDREFFYFATYAHMVKYGQGSQGGPPYFHFGEAFFYQSMPFVSTFYTGCNIKIIENLNLNLSAGYNLSLINYKYVKWRYDDYVKEDYKEKLKNAPIRTVALHSIAFQVSLNYTFSFKKKPKTVAP